MKTPSNQPSEIAGASPTSKITSFGRSSKTESAILSPDEVFTDIASHIIEKKMEEKTGG